MKLILTGWSRGYNTYPHEISPIELKDNLYLRSGVPGDPIIWDPEDPMHAKCCIHNTTLSGDFAMDVYFQERDLNLKGWLEQFIKKDPEAAVLLLAEMQVIAAKSLLEQRPRRSKPLTRDKK